MRTTLLQAALSQAAVSNALLISGMFMPKLGLVPFLGTTLLQAWPQLLSLGSPQ